MNTEPKFFVARIRRKDGSPGYQVYRQRVAGRIMKRTVVEVFHKVWKPVQVKFARVSKLFTSREAARREKKAYLGKPAKVS